MNTSGQPATEDPPVITDEQLMESIQESRQAALEELYHRHHNAMKCIILQILHNDVEADDLLDEVMDEIWHHAKDFSPAIGRPLAWMLTISRRRAIDRLRQRTAYLRTKDRFRIEMEHGTEAWNPANASDEIVVADERYYLDHIMEILPEPQRQVLELTYFQGMSQREIAKRTDTPLGTVKTRIELGLHKMSAAMVCSRDKIR